MAQQSIATPKFAVGEQVKSKHTDEYLGKITGITVLFYYDVENDNAGSFYEDDIEAAPKLTPEEAWAKCPIEIIGFIRGYNFRTQLPEYAHRTLRYNCYKILGGAGIKVDEGVKKHVRSLIQQVADLLGIEVVG